MFLGLSPFPLSATCTAASEAKKNSYPVCSTMHAREQQTGMPPELALRSVGQGNFQCPLATPCTTRCVLHFNPLKFHLTSARSDVDSLLSANSIKTLRKFVSLEIPLYLRGLWGYTVLKSLGDKGLFSKFKFSL